MNNGKRGGELENYFSEKRNNLFKVERTNVDS